MTEGLATVGTRAPSGLSRRTIEELSWTRSEPDWMLQRRLDAWERFEQTPMPSIQQEEWRRTDLSGLRLDRIVPMPPSSTPPTAPSPDGLSGRLKSIQAKTGDLAGVLVLQDGVPLYRRLDERLASRGVIFVDLDRAVRDYPDLVREHFMAQAVTPADGKFEALHGAIWTGGVLLYVPPHLEVDLPLLTVTSASLRAASAAPHTLVIADEGSRVTLIDQAVSPSSSGQRVASPAVEIIARAGAWVSYVNLQEMGRQWWNLSTMRALAHRDSSVQWVVVGLGGKVTKATVESRLVGPGAEARMLGLLFGDGQQHFDYYTVQDHQQPRTVSDLLFKSALKDQARSVYLGLIRVNKAAQQTDAYQANRNLLLSQRAKADSVPKLEIEANDVRCSHGATVAPVDREMLYYLMSRGLEQREAERLVVEGFFEPVVQRISLLPVRRQVWDSIHRKLRG